MKYQGQWVLMISDPREKQSIGCNLLFDSFCFSSRVSCPLLTPTTLSFRKPQMGKSRIQSTHSEVSNQILPLVFLDAHHTGSLAIYVWCCNRLQSAKHQSSPRPPSHTECKYTSEEILTFANAVSQTTEISLFATCAVSASDQYWVDWNIQVLPRPCIMTYVLGDCVSYIDYALSWLSIESFAPVIYLPSKIVETGTLGCSRIALSVVSVALLLTNLAVRILAMQGHYRGNPCSCAVSSITFQPPIISLYHARSLSRLDQFGNVDVIDKWGSGQCQKSWRLGRVLTKLLPYP